MQLHRAYDGGEWIVGTSFYYDAEVETWYFYDWNEEETIMVGEPEPQIGIYDSEGKAIYLNDIVQHRQGIGIIRYDTGQYYVDWQGGVFYESRLCLLGSLKVIGNLTEANL